MPDFPLADFINCDAIHPGSPESLQHYLMTQGWSADNTLAGSARAIFVPFVVYEPLRVTKMFTDNGGTVGSAANVDVGIYDAVGNRIVSSGSTARAGASTLQIFDITDTTLNAGLHYMAWCYEGTTGSGAQVAFSVAVDFRVGLKQQASAAFPLPDVAAWEEMGASFVPLFGLLTRDVT